MSTSRRSSQSGLSNTRCERLTEGRFGDASIKPLVDLPAQIVTEEPSALVGDGQLLLAGGSSAHGDRT